MTRSIRRRRSRANSVMQNSRIGICSLWVFAAAIASCDGPTRPLEVTSVRVSVSTAGATQDLDPDGYMLIVDGRAPQRITSNSEFIAPNIQPGSHTFELAGVAANCSVAGANPRPVVVGSDTYSATAAQTVAFSVSCAPNAGTLSITVNTSGVDQDADGYSLIIGGQRRSISANATLNVEAVRQGQLQIALDGIAGNCLPDKAVQIVEVAFKATTAVAFNVTCVAAGSLNIVNATSGVDLDPDGYPVTARLSDSNFFLTERAGINASVTLSSLRPGTYLLTFSGVALNCTVPSPQPVVVQVTAGAQTTVSVNVKCVTVSQFAFIRGVGPDADLWIMNANGTGSRQLTNSGGSEFFPAWSPDRAHIAYTSDRDGVGEIYVIDADGTKDIRVTNVQAYNGNPAWSPDGSRIAFESRRDGNIEIYTMNPDGTNITRLTNNNSFDGSPSWSPDGRKIAFASDRSGVYDIYTMDADGGNPARLKSETFAAFGPHWSPDGTRILMNTNTGPYIVNIDGTGLHPLFPSPGSAMDAIWSPDGRSIAFTVYASCSGGFDYYGPSCSYLQVANLDGTLSDFRVDDAYQPAWGK